jgi:hypothetical protein
MAKNLASNLGFGSLFPLGGGISLRLSRRMSIYHFEMGHDRFTSNPYALTIPSHNPTTTETKLNNFVINLYWLMDTIKRKVVFHLKRMFLKQEHTYCIWGSHSDSNEEFCLLGHNAVQSVEFHRTTRGYMPEGRTLDKLSWCSRSAQAKQRSWMMHSEECKWKRP